MTDTKKECAFCELLTMQDAAKVPHEHQMLVAFSLGKIAARAAKEPPLCDNHDMMIVAFGGMMSALAERYKLAAAKAPAAESEVEP